MHLLLQKSKFISITEIVIKIIIDFAFFNYTVCKEFFNTTYIYIVSSSGINVKLKI
jgi:hypothetical protein